MMQGPLTEKLAAVTAALTAGQAQIDQQQNPLKAQIERLKAEIANRSARRGILYQDFKLANETYKAKAASIAAEAAIKKNVLEVVIKLNADPSDGERLSKAHAGLVEVATAELTALSGALNEYTAKQESINKELLMILGEIQTLSQRQADAEKVLKQEERALKLAALENLKQKKTAEPLVGQEQGQASTPKMDV